MLDSAIQPSSATPAPFAPQGRDDSPYAKRQQVLHELTADSELLLKNRLEVRHLMSRRLATISPTTSVAEMTAIMESRRLRHLLVCGRSGELLGVVSNRDLSLSRGATAQQVMSYPALSCAPETPVGAAITYLINEHISCLPVVEQERPIGVLTTTDLILTLQCLLQLWMRPAQLLERDPTWSKNLETITHSLDGPLNAEDLADRIASARQSIHGEVERLLNAFDLRADLLTGLGNRRDLEEVTNLLLGVQKRFGRPFSLAVIKIEHYRRIRESCGEAVTNSLLKAVKLVIEESVEEGNLASRMSDDAFAVVLPETRKAQADEFCERLRDAARRSSQLDVALRIRVAAIEATTSEDVAALLDRAAAVVA